MRIRSRLIIAFLIMTLFPISIMTISVTFILNRQFCAMEDSYSINQNFLKNTQLLINPSAFLYNVTLDDYENLSDIATKNPNSLSNPKYLNRLNKLLKKKDSFLVIFRGNTCLYKGNLNLYKKISSFPVEKNTNNYQKNSSHITYIDQNASLILKEKSFKFSDGSIGQLYMITDFSKLYPHWKRSVEDILVAFLLILFITGGVLTIWIYQSIIRPLNILRIATMQIGTGDLDKPIKINSSNEIGQLGNDFEEMRIRLKELILKSIHSEENTRDIMSSISHDLKTPITAIKGYTEGILDGVADTPEKQKKYLQTIYTKANDMTYLIDELSIFSKVEQNSLAYNFVAVNANNYFSDCIEDFSLDLESQNISIEFSNSVDKSTNILVDPEQLKRVIHNIIGNAVKYNDKENGHICVTIQNVDKLPTRPPLYRQLNEDGSDRVPRESPEDFIQVQIKDDGPGIASKDLPHIFDRFFRADASRNSSKRGSGLGLAIVKMIISDHGGKVWAESIEGEGSTFFFTIKKDIKKEGDTNE